MAIHGFGEIAEQLRRSTVVVHVGGRGNGSGVIWTADGVIVTNAHVARASQMRIQLWDGREFDAVLVSRDTRRDLAELRISAANLPVATAADSSQIRPGELAIAIGNPLGFVGALTTGVIHAIGPLHRGFQFASLVAVFDLDEGVELCHVFGDLLQFFAQASWRSKNRLERYERSQNLSKSRAESVACLRGS